MDLTLTGTMLERFVAALLIGILVGMEREWSGGESDSSTPFAGIRTFPLISLGGFTAAFATEYAAWSFAAGFLFLGGLAATAHFVRAGREGDLGTTTPIAALVVYLLGHGRPICPIPFCEIKSLTTIYRIEVTASI